jgi:hypothetical protein
MFFGRERLKQGGLCVAGVVWREWRGCEVRDHDAAFRRQRLYKSAGFPSVFSFLVFLGSSVGILIRLPEKLDLFVATN